LFAFSLIHPKRKEEVMALASVAAPPQRRNAVRQNDDSRQLLERWRKYGDRQAHELLARRFDPLARKLARRYAHTSEPFEDLLQVASLGLLKALERFDPDRQTAFVAFAVPTILGELRRYFRDCSWGVHVPRDLQEQALAVGGAQEQLTNEHGRAPTVNELAEYLELPPEQVLDALLAAQAYDPLALDVPASGTAEREHPVTYLDTLGHTDKRYEQIELDATLATALQNLPARERAIIRLRFIEELSQTEIGQRIGISQMQVSRLLRRSLAQLRTLAQAHSEGP
jgi:RNA polymerase sigma-B factor